MFKSEGPQRKKYDWENKEENYEIEFWNMSQKEINEYYQKKRQEKTSDQRSEVHVKYHFKPKSNDSA